MHLRHDPTGGPDGHLKGMTVVELLVTISVIAILAAILIPTVGAVRDNARQAQCASNLRQIYTVLQLYANDHQGYLPTASRPKDTTVPPKQSSTSRWSRDLDEYLPQSQRAVETTLIWENEIFVCPAALSLSGKSGPGYVRMAYNGSSAWYGDDGADRFTPRGYNTIVSPASTPLLYDGQMRFEVQTNYYANWPQANGDRSSSPESMSYFSFRHNGKMNLLMADGAVQSVTPTWLDALTKEKWKGIE